MKAEIISVGTELLLGHVINTDAVFVARMLAELGINLTNIQMVGDNPVRLKQALELASERADLLITTGGLGPTRDDLTKRVCAEFAHKKLNVDQELLNALKDYFVGHIFTENQISQALTVEDGVIFPNDHGTASGLVIPFVQGKFILLLPGPPRELEPMLENYVKPWLAQFSNQVIVSWTIRVFGKGEGEVDDLLGELLNGNNPTVAPYASNGEMFIKLTCKATSEDDAVLLLEPLAETIIKKIGNSAYGINVENLETAVVTELRRKKLTVGTAESCTGGLLAKRITDIPGASAIFNLGVVTYSNEEKTGLLGVNSDILAQFGAVSPEVAHEMAVNIKRKANADFGIGITGIAGPDGGTEAKPLGLVYIGVSNHKKTIVYKMEPENIYRGRKWVRRMASSRALFLLKEQIDYLADMGD